MTNTSDWSQQLTQETEPVDEEDATNEEGEEEEESYSEPPEEAKLFVGNLPYDFDSEKLANLFNSAGVVDIAEVLIDLLFSNFLINFVCCIVCLQWPI